MKYIITPPLCPEEIEFARKYGTNLFQIWDKMPEQLKENYNIIENLYSDFVSLLRDNYEDLKYYAIMFRNIPLYNCANDIYSVLFFASHYDEIIGYKKKVNATKNDKKYKVLKLYIENEALFPKLCQKYIGVNFQKSRNQPVQNCLNREIFKNFNNEDFLKFLSVSDLSSEQCDTILFHSSKRCSEYPQLYKEYLGDSFKIHRFDTDEKSLFEKDNRLAFVKRFYIPLLTNGQNKFMLSRITKYLVQNGLNKNIILRDIDLIHQNHEQSLALKKQISSINVDLEKIRSDKNCADNVNDQIQYTYISQLENELRNLKRSSFNSFLGEQHNMSNLETMLKFGFNPETRKDISYEDIQKVREDIAKSKQRKANIEAEIVQLEEQLRKEKSKARFNEEQLRLSFDDKINKMEYNIKNIADELNSIEEKTEKELMCSDSVLFIFYNQEKVFKYVETSIEKLYNLSWLRNPKKMHSVESFATNSSIYELYYLSKSNSLEPRRNVPFYHRKDKKTGLIKLFFSQRVLMRNWIQSYEEELEEEKRKIQEQKDAELKRKKQSAEDAERKRKAKYEFNLTNLSIRDSFLQFNPSNHLYKLGSRILESVTQLIENLFPTFDKFSHAKTTAHKKNMTVQQVLDIWERKGRESRELGTILHDKIENYFLGKIVEEDDSFRLFKQFETQFSLRPYRTEWAVYDEDSGIAGTIDFVDNTNNIYSIYDWKRSDKVIVNGFPVKVNSHKERGNYPIENLDNTPYWHYALQLSMYKYILEKNYNLKITHLRLGIFHPSYNKPYVLEMPYLEREINLIVNLKSDIIF